MKGCFDQPRPDSIPKGCHRLLGLGLWLVLLTVPGCAFERHREQLARFHSKGEYEAAAASLDDPKVHNLYDAEDQVLWHMDRASVALALSDTQTALTNFELAKKDTEFNDTKSAGEVVGEWLLNDTVRRYVAEPYEDMYLSVLTMVALLEDGRVESGAANEAKRFGTRANYLRERFNQQYQAVQKQGGPQLKAAEGSNGSRGLKGSKGIEDFVESPLGVYLASLSFMAAGDADAQRIAAERLTDAIERQKGMIGAVDATKFSDLAGKSPETANVVVVAFSGRGPTKTPFRLPPIVIDKVQVYVEIPILKKHESRVYDATVEVEGEGTTGLALIEDMSGVAMANYDRIMPMIQARAVARALVKAGVAYAVTETVDKSSKRNDAARWLTQIGLLAAQIATEHVDIRCWAFLPGQARVTTLKLQPGKYRVRVVYSGMGGGAAHVTPWKDVDVGTGPLRAIVTHYWD